MKLALLSTLAVMAIAGPVSADSYRRVQTVVALPSYPEGVGCYWYQGDEFCSRYCYWEVNGRRYCTSRLRNAYPQGFAHGEAPVPYGPGSVSYRHEPAPETDFIPPLKLGAGPTVRPRH